jgi:tetratricopeptide (TPR) repeat protein
MAAPPENMLANGREHATSREHATIEAQLSAYVPGGAPMGQKTAACRLTHSEPERLSRVTPVAELTPLEGSLKLICGKCNCVASYRVGSVSISPQYFEASDRETTKSEEIDAEELEREQEAFDTHVGFSAYFRCRDCNAGGPWTLSRQARMRIKAKLIIAAIGHADHGVRIGECKLYDGTDIRYPTQAEDIFRERLARDPNDDALWMRLGNTLRNAGRLDLARPAYEKSLELNPRNLDAHLMLAQLLEEKNAPRKALEHWLGALRSARYAVDIPRDERLAAISTALERGLILAKDPREVFGLVLEIEPAAEPSTEPRTVRWFDLDTTDPDDWHSICRVFLGEPLRTREELDARENPADLNWHAVDDQPVDYGMRSLTGGVGVEPEGWNDQFREPVMLGPRIGRNDPCPCGSGRKHKKCCGRSSCVSEEGC